MSDARARARDGQPDDRAARSGYPTLNNQGLAVDFEYTAASAVATLFLDSGTWDTSNYRRWGFLINGGQIEQHTYQGLAGSSAVTPLLSLQANVWYRALFKIVDNGEFVLGVWQRDNPSQGVVVRTVLGPNWAGLAWHFDSQVQSPTEYLDNYAELQFNTTRYGYDVLNNLVWVADPAGNMTTMSYDPLNRKIGMNDPDMGVWSYSYDPAGNLLSQTDAKGQTITFTYDVLNRMTSKAYPAGSGMTNVSYGYDAGPSGIGQRTSLSDGSGSTSWGYDSRGRLLTTTQTLNGVTYSTTNRYDAADRARTLSYPADHEVVTNSYSTARGLLSTVIGSAKYVSQTLYNMLAQPTSQTAGNNLATLYTYRPDNYRLQHLTVGSGLLDLQYAYDPVGNVSTITDTLSGQAQAQSFGYDMLSRLISASTNAVGNGQYSESYSYDSLGNLTKVPLTTTYGYTLEVNFVDDSLPTGAVAGADGSDGWTWVSSNPTPAYGAKAHQSVVASGEHQHYFTGASYPLAIGKGDVLFAYVYLDPANLPSEVMLQWHNGVDGSWEHRAFWGSDSITYWGVSGANSRRNMGSLPASGTWVRLEVPASQVGLEGVVVDGMAFALYNGKATWDRAGVQKAHGGRPHAVTSVGSDRLAYDGNGNVYTRTIGGIPVTYTFDVDNRLVKVMTGTYTVTYGYNGDGQRTTRSDASGTTIYVGSLYEKNLATQVASKYYFFAGKRVALNQGGQLYFLAGDQLGSTSLTTNLTGTVVAQDRYYPFGGTRWESGATPTDFRYTSQRMDSYINMVEMGARWYDQQLSRFASADSIVPNPGNPQALNRYSYSYNNPIRYVDPSGHSAQDDYVLIQGCVDSGQGDACGNKPETDWKNYIDFLKATFSVDDDWVSAHVSFVRAANADPSGIAAAVGKLNPGNGSIYLIGHSVGGAALLNYLKDLKESNSASLPHIGGAFVIDGPIGLGPISGGVGQYVGFERMSFGGVVAGQPIYKDNLEGLGAWAREKGITLMTVSYEDDWINPLAPVTDISHKLVGHYGPYNAGPFDFQRNHAYLLQDAGGAQRTARRFVRTATTPLTPTARVELPT